jgi:hypothetical protein
METTNEIPPGNEPAEEEDPNISNLLVSKSERAPATEAVPPLKQEKVTAELMKTAALSVLGSAAVMFVIVLGCWLFFRPGSGREGPKS